MFQLLPCRNTQRLHYEDWSINPVREIGVYCELYTFFFTFLNLLAPELFFYILAHHIYKMWIKQEPNMLDLWNKLHFEGKKTESIYYV